MSAADTVKDIVRITAAAGLSKDVIDLLEKKVALLSEQLASMEQENTTLLRENRNFHLVNEDLKRQLENARPKGDELDDVCKQMLITLANHDPSDGITDDELIQHLGLQKARGDHLFAHLRERKLVRSGGGQMGRGFFWFVTDAGLKYLADNRLLDAKPQKPFPTHRPSRSAGFGRRQGF